MFPELLVETIGVWIVWLCESIRAHLIIDFFLVLNTSWIYLQEA